MNPTGAGATDRATIEVDAALIAPGLGLDVDGFRRLMAAQRIAVLCERGTGADAGRVRGTFYYAGRRVRIVVDAAGNPVAPAAPVADGQP